jgi:pSer/pThr/pTyr-binding forkhead associated (FHA) protein
MSIRSRIILYFLVGGLAGFLVWLITEPAPYFEPIFVVGVPFEPLPFERALSSMAGPLTIRGLMYGGLFGLLLGGALGFASSVGKSGLKLARNTAIGIGAGLVCGMIGNHFGDVAYNLLGGNPASGLETTGSLGFLEYIWQIAARATGWAMFGFVLGASQGLVEWSGRKAWHGMVGGLIGGFIGGAVFNMINDIVGSGSLSRLVGACAIGCFTGLLIALVEDILKGAWIQVVAGRGEGKEYILTKPITSVGRNELSDIPLFGDLRVMRTHAAIKIVGNRYTIVDQGTPTGTLVNGHAAPSAMLKDGDEIQIGNHKLLFFEKATAPRFAFDKDRAAPEPLPPIPEIPGICPFCGERKDPRTGACACTPVGAPAAPIDAGQVGSAAPSVAGIPIPGTPTPQPGAGPRLVGTDGPYAGAVFQITAQAATIGREAGQDLQLSQDGTVSRKHAVIALEGGVYVLRDQGSSNGTCVNGQRVTQATLQSGDTVQIGATKFRFEA